MKDCSKGRIFHSYFLYPFSVFSSCYIARDHNNRRTNGRRTKSSNELFSSLVVLTCKNCFLICQISISTRNAGGELRATKKREWMAWGGMGKKTRYYPTPEKRINIYWQQKVRFRRERFAALFFNNLRGGVVGGRGAQPLACDGVEAELWEAAGGEDVGGWQVLGGTDRGEEGHGHTQPDQFKDQVF